VTELSSPGGLQALPLPLPACDTSLLHKPDLFRVWPSSMASPRGKRERARERASLLLPAGSELQPWLVPDAARGHEQRSAMSRSGEQQSSAAPRRSDTHATRPAPAACRPAGGAEPARCSTAAQQHSDLTLRVEFSYQSW